MPATILLLCLALAGCKSKPADAEAKAPDAWIVYPVYRNVQEFEDFTGQTDSEFSVVVKARATGHLEKINFTDGAMVKQGDVLFELDQREYKAALDRAVAELEQYKAQLEQSKAQLVQYQARTNRLEKEHSRGIDLVAPGQKAMSQEAFDRIVGDLAETRALVRLAEATKRSAEAYIKVAEANKTTAEYNLDWCKVTAKISGRVSRRAVDIGNIIEKEKTVLTNIVSLDPMYAKFFIDERTVLRLRGNVKDGKLMLSQDQKLRFRIGLADETGYSIDGKLDFIDNKIDTGTGTLQVRGTFDNTMYVPGTWPWERFTNQRLPVGLFIRIRLPVGDPQDRLLVPEKAIGVDQDKKFVYIVNDKNEVERRAVKLGTLQEDGMRVIEEGLDAKMMVIVKGLQRVRPGMAVAPKVDTTPLGQ